VSRAGGGDGTWVEQREYLHTTMVAIEALVTSADAGTGDR
jgi:hypothetical protein